MEINMIDLVDAEAVRKAATKKVIEAIENTKIKSNQIDITKFLTDSMDASFEDNYVISDSGLLAISKALTEKMIKSIKGE